MMPTTRRSAGAARGRTGPTKGQSTISFTNKVTKAVPKEVKSLVASAPAKTTKIEVPERTKPLEKIERDVSERDDDEEDEREEDSGRQSASVVPERSEAEMRAEKLSDGHIKRYWGVIERERKAPRVHQEGLSVNDKVLRYFDVSSQYGPCIGIERTKRWERAERLGLNPPIEVLAVLIKERQKSAGGVGTAHMDSILNSIATGS